MKKIGIVLSGGGARGIAHLGVIKALGEFGVKPEIISGTSAGSLIGAFYAAGYDPDEILNIAKHAGLFNILDLKFYHGIFSMHAFEKTYHKHIPHNSFEQLNMPLYVAATDILKCKTVYFSSGDLTKALMASSCVPMAFQPVKYDEREYVDGGILNNLPLEPLEGKCESLIGVHVNALDTPDRIHTMDLIDRSFHLAVRHAVEEKEPRFDLFIEPPDMTRFKVFDVKHFDDIFETGYEHTIKLKKQIEQFQKNSAKA